MKISNAGWGWVLENAPQIQKASKFYAQTRGFDVDDFHQELVIRLARRAPDYDPGKGSVSTWVGYQAKAVCSAFRDRRIKLKAEAPPDPLMYMADPRSEKHIEAKCSVGMVKRSLPSKDFSILLARAFSFTDEQCKATLGISRWGASRKAISISQKFR